jgi:hypothetical protein
MEGKIETVKTRYGLGKLMTKTEVTSENWVLSFLNYKLAVVSLVCE